MSGPERATWRAAISDVALAWLASRLIVVGAGILAAALVHGEAANARTFAVWDGFWYGDIARLGYELDRPDRPHTPYPFFPLLPWILRAADAVGLPMFGSGLLLNGALFFVGLLGLHRLVRRWSDAPTATLAVWAAALLPGSQAYSMVYPEALFFAASVWAFWFAEQAETSPRALATAALAVGALGALASLVRPNGLVVPFSLAFGALATGRASWSLLAAYLVPACLGVGGWMLHLWIAKGDPFIWIRAKAAWTEVTLFSVFDGVDQRGQLVADVAPMPLVAAALWCSWAKLPASWRTFAALWVALPLLTGVTGWPRYAASCFPVAAALGAALAPLPQQLQRRALALSALWLSCYAYVVLMPRICP